MVQSRSATIYLFGAVHALPPDFPWMDDRIQRALDSSDEIWTETDPTWLPKDKEAMRRYGTDATHNLPDRLPTDYRDRLITEMAQAGIKPAVYMHVRPWLADVLLTKGALEQAGLGVRTGVESSLFAYARAHGKPTASFETIDEQLAIFGDLPDQDQLLALQEEIDNFGLAGDSLNALINAWFAGNQPLLDQLTNQRLQQSSPRTWTDIVLRRNGEFAKKISERLSDSGTVFIALGAAHLCGSDSVQSLLRNYGYNVVRLPDGGANSITVQINGPQHP